MRTIPAMVCVASLTAVFGWMWFDLLSVAPNPPSMPARILAFIVIVVTIIASNFWGKR